MKKLSLFALILLAGCGYGGTADPVYLPDGSAGYHITCGGTLGKPGDCIAQASTVCGSNGYQMYDAAGKPLSPDAQNQSVIAALNNAPAPKRQSSDATQSMFVKCKNAPLDPITLHTPQVDTQPIPLNGK